MRAGHKFFCSDELLWRQNGDSWLMLALKLTLTLCLCQLRAFSITIFFLGRDHMPIGRGTEYPVLGRALSPSYPCIVSQAKEEPDFPVDLQNRESTSDLTTPHWIGR